MRKSRFSEEQIIAVLKAAEAGQKMNDVCRKHGISEHTFYRWRAKYGGLEVSDARKLRSLVRSPSSGGAAFSVIVSPSRSRTRLGPSTRTDRKFSCGPLVSTCTTSGCAGS